MSGNNKVNENNTVNLTGVIVSDLIFSHETFGEKFYMVNLEVKRKSGIADVLRLMISERLIDVTQNYIGAAVEVDGQFRSYNSQKSNIDSKTVLILSVFVTDIRFSDLVEDDTNKIKLEGFFCKKPRYRETPNGRKITDVLLAVNRAYGKSDYIPCIAWGRNAEYLSDFEVGTKIQVEGRIQSREYTKWLNESESETRIAYEISISKLNILN